MKQDPIPQSGGSYTRDEKTGALVKNTPAKELKPQPAAPAQAEKEQSK